MPADIGASSDDQAGNAATIGHQKQSADSEITDTVTVPVSVEFDSVSALPDVGALQTEARLRKRSITAHNDDSTTPFLDLQSALSLSRLQKPSAYAAATSLVPALQWLRTYDVKANLKADLVAGLTVGIMLVPQGMAYAMIAGLPPANGLYASVMPVYVYALFGTSRQLAVGPVAIVSLLVDASLRSVGLDAAEDEAKYVRCARTLAMLVGLFQVALGALRWGFLVNFLSHPVISGFTSAAAITIAFTQVKHLVGYDIQKSPQFNKTIKSFFEEITAFHWQTFLAGIVWLAIILAMKHAGKFDAKYKFLRALGPLTVVVLSTVTVAAARWNEAPVEMKVVGAIKSGLPDFSADLDWGLYSQLVTKAVFISFVGFMESIAIGKTLAAKNKYEIDSNQELVGLGLANVVGALSGGYPITGSFSRSAVNHETGAKTALASIVTATVVLLTLLLLSEALYFLPKSALGAIVISAVSGLVDTSEWKFLLRTDRKDFFVWNVSFFVTLFLGVERGILTAMVMSLVFVIHLSARPHTAQLGRLPGTTVFRNTKQYHEAATQPGVVAFRVDAPIYFANVSFVKDRLRQVEEEYEAGPRMESGVPLQYLILEMGPVTAIDSTGIHALKDLLHDYQERSIGLVLANPNFDVLDSLEKAELPALIGRDRIFLRVHDALKWCLRRMEEDPEAAGSTSVAAQGAACRAPYQLRVSMDYRPSSLDKARGTGQLGAAMPAVPEGGAELAAMEREFEDDLAALEHEFQNLERHIETTLSPHQASPSPAADKVAPSGGTEAEAGSLRSFEANLASSMAVLPASDGPVEPKQALAALAAPAELPPPRPPSGRKHPSIPGTPDQPPTVEEFSDGTQSVA